MNSKETIYKTIPLHYLLEPIDIRILSDKIRDVRIPCPLTWDPTANISFQTSWVIGEEGQRPIYLWFSKRREHGSEVHDMAAGPSGKGYIWEKRKLTSWTVPFQHIHLLLQVGCSLREELPCWQEHSCNCGLHKFHFHSWSSHFHQIQGELTESFKKVMIWLHRFQNVCDLRERFWPNSNTVGSLRIRTLPSVLAHKSRWRDGARKGNLPNHD
jgi:hypothetical protein